MEPGRPSPSDIRDAADYVSALRRLKKRSGLSYRQLERRAEAVGEALPRSTAAQALKGRGLPRREVAEAFVRACTGLDQAETECWLAAYDRLASGATAPQDPGPAPQPADNTRRDAPRTPRRRLTRRAGATTVDPAGFTDAAAFVTGLRWLKARSGFSYRQLERRAEAVGEALPRSTAAQALKGRELPRREVVEAFVRACLGPERTVAEAAYWLAAYDRLADPAPPDAAPADAVPTGPVTAASGAPTTWRPSAPVQPVGKPQASPMLVLPLPPARAGRGPVHRRRLRRLLGLGGLAVTLSSATAVPSASAPPPPVSWWRFEEGGGPVATDAQRRNPLRLTGGTRRVAVPSGRALLMDGTGRGTAARSALPPGGDLSVTVWARLDTADHPGTLLTLRYGDGSELWLGYEPFGRRWAARLTGPPGRDATVRAERPATPGTWTHLALVHDAAAEELLLYVDADPADPRSCDLPDTAPEPVRIGGPAKGLGRPAEGWYGAVDDLRLYDRLLNPGQVNHVLNHRA
ncbi:LamG-like jellyroll fold domain-containing protein [Spirillospora sp. CA-253888]